MKLTFFILPLIFLLNGAVQAQSVFTLKKGEDSLAILSKKILEEPSDSVRLELNNAYRTMLMQVTAIPGSFSYPFDSLLTLSKLTAPDKAFRIYNWNLPMNNGSNRYFCLIQVAGTKKIGERLIGLTDRSDSIANPDGAVLAGGQWYGALYYRILAVKQGKKTIYTLLGWDGISPAVSQKLIEILTFDANGAPRFGARIFRDFRKGQQARIFFRYAASASMLLRPDLQSMPSEKSGKKTPMILCDRLVPLDPRTEGQTDFYIPASDIYDGFIWTGSVWKFIRGIEGRNY